MTLLLNPRLWIALALAAVLGFSHFTAYRIGKSVVRAEWDKDKAARMAQALEAEQAARKKEQELLAQREQVEKKYADEKRKAVVAAAGARAELDRLRDELAAPRDRACKDPAPAGRADGGTVEGQLLGACATALVAVASDADRLAAQVIGLQQYVAGVCRKP